MLVKLYNKNEGTSVTKLMKSLSETNEDKHEVKFIFKTEPGIPYEVQIEYSGDVYNEHGEEVPCSYFDMTIAINSMQALGKQLDCDSSYATKQADSLLTSLPKEIDSSKLNYRLNGYFVMRYP